MRKKTPVLKIAIATWLTLAVSGPLMAQEAARPGQGRRGARANEPGPAAELRAAEVMTILDGYALVQAQEALQLNDAQYGQFVTRLRKLQETRRKGQQERHRIIQELRKLAGPQAPPADETALRTQVKALRDHDDRTAEEVRKAYDALDEVLDPRQQARFRLFEERLELRKMDLLMRARQGAARGRSPQ